ncbi:PAX-interacting protein 1 [Mixophyes fleayi]|uniref:PAX-interacting protein 1 n=1 Tax=Mixophyes fleayi TaxID=3061075 RepID=UPI003F4DEE22
MAEPELKVPEDMFKDVKFYLVGDLDPQVVQMLKAGKAKEVSYNALATHIIAEDGDNPEVGEAREVFDLPIVKPSWVILSVRCGARLPENGFSPESGQIFFGVTACLSQVSPDDRSALWALITFYGGDCQLSLNKKCTHLIVPEPKGTKYEYAYQRESIKIVAPDWVLDSISGKTRKDEAPYHPRLTVYEEEEEEDEEVENEDQDSQNASADEDRYSSKSSPITSREGSPFLNQEFSPKRSSTTKVKEELMFDDSSDSSPEKQERNLNWTPAEVPQMTTAKRRLPQGKDSGLINLCANVPPVPGNILPPEARSNLLTSVPGTTGSERPDMMAFRSPAARTLRNITNSADIQQINRPSNVAHLLQTLSASTKSLEQQGNHPQQGHPNTMLFNQVKSLTPETQHLLQQQSHQTPQQQQQQQQQQQHHSLVQLQPQQLMQLQQQQQITQQVFPAHQFSQVNQPHHFTQLQFSQQQLHRPQQQTMQHFQQQHVLQQQLQQLQQQQQHLQQQQNIQQILQRQQTPSQQQTLQQQQQQTLTTIQQQQNIQQQQTLQTSIQQQQALQPAIQQQQALQQQNQALQQNLQQSIQQLQQQNIQHLSLQQKQQLQQHALQQQQIQPHALQQQITSHTLQQQQQQIQTQALQQQQIQSQTIQQQVQPQTIQQHQAQSQQPHQLQTQSLPQQPHHVQPQTLQQPHQLQQQTLQQHQIQSHSIQLQHQIQTQAHQQHQIPSQMLQQQTLTQQQLHQQQQTLQLQQQQIKQQQMQQQQTLLQQQQIQQQTLQQQQQIQQATLQQQPSQIQQQTLKQSQVQQGALQQPQIQQTALQQPPLQTQQAQQQKHNLQQMQQHFQRLQQRQMQNQTQQQLGQMPQQMPPQAPNQQLVQSQQLHGHDPSLEIPEDCFLMGCVFAIADYPEQMSDKQLLATWKRIIQTHGGTVDPTLTSRCTHLLCESQVSSMYAQAMKERRRCITAHWLNTVLKKKKMVPPHRTLHFPVAFPPGGKPCSQHIISVTGFVDSDRDDLKLMAYLAGAKYTGYLCRSNTVLICKEPSGLKYEKAKEWRIPCVNALWLCDILLGNFEALRQIQNNRYTVFNLQDPLAPSSHLVSNLLDAWRIPIKVSSDVLMSIRIPLKPKQNVPAVQPKRPRIEDLPPPTKKLSPDVTPHVMFTGFDPAQIQQYVKKLYILGGEVVDSAQKCTHLIASKVTRTVKFLTAISVAKHIVTPEWLDESFKCQKFVEEQSYILRDAEAEVLFCFSLEESLKRARVAPLFKGKYFYITPGICPSLSTMKSIVECAGGKILTKPPSFRKIVEHKQNKSLAEIILISCENDLHLCREYFTGSIDVHNAEFVLTGVLTQTLDYESYKFT